MDVAIIKYNAGNIYSVDYALKRLGVTPIITADPELLNKADKVIFPGVGEAFTTMEYLREHKLDQVILNLKQPVLGICLGMQLMCMRSEEGNADCLGIFPTEVKRFIPQKHEDKVPHMGWNTLTNVKSGLFNERLENKFVYFVHSYYVPVNEYTAATTDYILPFSAALHKDNFYATQFHPEKSGSVGEVILKTFKDMIELIPAIDIIDGKCVRLTQGDYATKKVYNEDPLEVAKMFEGNGIRRLHVVDLDGAREGRIINYRILERIATRTSLIIDFGGGLKQEDDLKIAFESGAQMVTGGSIAVKNPEMFTSWISKFGSEKIILGADAKEKKIAISGWEETTSQELVPFIKGYYDKGITKVICTDIARDGMLQGPAIDLYKEIRDEIPFLYIIASGGVSSIEDIEKLSEAGIPAVIFGKAIYEGKIQLKDLLRFT